MDCVLGGSNSADTTVIRNMLWGQSQGLISPGCPRGRLGHARRETFPTPHPAFLCLPHLGITFKDCGLVRASGLGRARVGSWRWYHGLGATGAGIFQGSCTFSHYAAGGWFPLPHPSPVPKHTSSPVLPQ